MPFCQTYKIHSHSLNAILFSKTSATFIEMKKEKRETIHAMYLLYLFKVCMVNSIRLNIIAVTKSDFPFQYQTDQNGKAAARRQKNQIWTNTRRKIQNKSHKSKFIHFGSWIERKLWINVKVLKCKETRIYNMYVYTRVMANRMKNSTVK